jgi:stearoyl-CoA desaturase (delta-9 desaturase)
VAVGKPGWVRPVLPSWIMVVPFVFLHLALISLVWIPCTVTSLCLCVGLYAIRMFGITGGFHRYFAHRAYKTSRPFQFVLAWIGCSSMQKGPLWWASHHRDHHRHSDTEVDPHSPHTTSFWWSHVGWVLGNDFQQIVWKNIPDFKKYPELLWLDQFHWVPGLTTAIICYLIDGFSGLTWGFLLSTIILYHGTFTINSLCHLWGNRRFKTTDDSRNSLVLALVTLGEGWHNNHHHYQGSVNQGFYWWEIDISYCTLLGLSKLGLVWDLRKPTERALNSSRLDRSHPVESAS